MIGGFFYLTTQQTGSINCFVNCERRRRTTDHRPQIVFSVVGRLKNL